MTGGFCSQRASNVENISICWRHYQIYQHLSRSSRIYPIWQEEYIVKNGEYLISGNISIPLQKHYDWFIQVIVYFHASIEGFPVAKFSSVQCCLNKWKQIVIAAIWFKCHLFAHGGPIHYMMTSSNGNISRVTRHLCGNSPVPSEFPSQRPVTWSFDVFGDLRRYRAHYDVTVMTSQ